MLRGTGGTAGVGVEAVGNGVSRGSGAGAAGAEQDLN